MGIAKRGLHTYYSRAEAGVTLEPTRRACQDVTSLDLTSALAAGSGVLGA
jgi:hypothetical protein